MRSRLLFVVLSIALVFLALCLPVSSFSAAGALSNHAPSLLADSSSSIPPPPTLTSSSPTGNTTDSASSSSTAADDPSGDDGVEEGFIHTDFGRSLIVLIVIVAVVAASAAFMYRDTLCRRGGSASGYRGREEMLNESLGGFSSPYEQL